MATPICVTRLQKELKALIKDPLPNIIAKPLASNILEWHYVIFGPSGSAYEGGVYHGKVKFPPEYPHKPPSIYMITPSGRFACNRRLCLSMSDYHPETWNPLWSVASILNGLLSFMLDKTPTLGSVETSDSEKRTLAARSMDYNAKDPVFRKLFPTLVRNHQQHLGVRSQVSQNTVVAEGDDDTVENEEEAKNQNKQEPVNNNNNNNNNIFLRGSTLLKAAGVILSAVVFVSVFSRVYM